jgi:hypothetical protein
MRLYFLRDNFFHAGRIFGLTGFSGWEKGADKRHEK